jgi:predicted aspartyl protease
VSLRALALLLASLLSACAELAGVPERPCGLTASVILPMERVGPFGAVPSSFNGIPAVMLFDTGAGNTVISEAAARRTGVAADPQRMMRATGIGGAGTYPTGQVGSMVLGGVPVRRPLVTIMPAVPIGDGNVGMDILGDADLDIDMPSGRIVLHRGHLCPGEMPPWDVPATELEAVPRMSRHLPAGARPMQLMVAMELEGQRALAVLDTGAARTVVSHRFAERLGIGAEKLAAQPGVTMRGLSQETGRGHLWRFRSARVGADEISAPAAVVADLHDLGFDVLLGMDYLLQRRVWISFGARRVLVAHPRPG